MTGALGRPTGSTQAGETSRNSSRTPWAPGSSTRKTTARSRIYRKFLSTPTKAAPQRRMRAAPSGYLWLDCWIDLIVDVARSADHWDEAAGDFDWEVATTRR